MTQDMQGMPKEVWVASATKGYQAATYQLVGGVKYVKLDIAEQLAKALEFYSKASPIEIVSDAEFKETEFGSVIIGGLRAKSALAAYNNAKNGG